MNLRSAPAKTETRYRMITQAQAIAELIAEPTAESTSEPRLSSVRVSCSDERLRVRTQMAASLADYAALQMHAVIIATPAASHLSSVSKLDSNGCLVERVVKSPDLVLAWSLCKDNDLFLL